MTNHQPEQPGSVGKQQRVVVARARARRPATLMAEDPTSSQDSRPPHNVIKIFPDIHASEATVLLAVQNRKCAGAADCMFEMNHGGLACVG